MMKFKKETLEEMAETILAIVLSLVMTCGGVIMTAAFVADSAIMFIFGLIAVSYPMLIIYLGITKDFIKKIFKESEEKED